MFHRRCTTPLLGLTAATALTLAGVGAAASNAVVRPAAGGSPVVLNQTVEAPYHLAAGGGRLLVADGGTSTVSRVLANGTLRTIAEGANPGEVAGIAIGDGGIGYTTSNYQSGAGSFVIHRPGHADVVADISGFEAAHNPDQHVHYGVEGHVSACVRKALTAVGAPVQYTGVVDSHAYADAYAGNGSWYVADAAGNDILKVSPRGRVSLVRVLPKQRVKITKALAKANGVPSCTVGITYDGEAVPTGIQVVGNELYVSTLPGGATAPNGSIYRMKKDGSHLVRVATGFVGATDVAVGPAGRIYVAELDAGVVASVWHGRTTTVASLPGVVSVAYGNGHLYAGTVGPTDENDNPTGPGSIVEIR
jgi:hypothetical protein